MSVHKAFCGFQLSLNSLQKPLDKLMCIGCTLTVSSRRAERILFHGLIFSAKYNDTEYEIGIVE